MRGGYEQTMKNKDDRHQAIIMLQNELQDMQLMSVRTHWLWDVRKDMTLSYDASRMRIVQGAEKRTDLKYVYRSKTKLNFDSLCAL